MSGCPDRHRATLGYVVRGNGWLILLYGLLVFDTVGLVANVWLVWSGYGRTANAVIAALLAPTILLLIIAIFAVHAMRARR